MSTALFTRYLKTILLLAPTPTSPAPPRAARLRTPASRPPRCHTGGAPASCATAAPCSACTFGYAQWKNHVCRRACLLAWQLRRRRRSELNPPRALAALAAPDAHVELADEGHVLGVDLEPADEVVRGAVSARGRRGIARGGTSARGLAPGDGATECAPREGPSRGRSRAGSTHPADLTEILTPAARPPSPKNWS